VKDGERGRAEAPAPRSDVGFRLDQKTAYFKASIASRAMQWSVLTEEKQKNQIAQTGFRFIKTTTTIIIIINNGRQLLAVLCLHISVALQQKTANFKVAIASRPMQWSPLTEEKQKNQLAQTEFRFIKTTIVIIIWGGGNYSQSFASTSALHSSKRRQISRWPS
jgi:hypothetical protein